MLGNLSGFKTQLGLKIPGHNFTFIHIDVYLNISHHNVFTKAKEDIINLTILWPCSEKHNIMLVYILRKRFIT